MVSFQVKRQKLFLCFFFLIYLLFLVNALIWELRFVSIDLSCFWELIVIAN